MTMKSAQMQSTPEQKTTCNNVKVQKVQTEKIRLRPVVAADLECLFEQQNDPIANQLAQFTPREHSAFFAHWHNNILTQESVISRAIVLNEQLIGNIVSWDRDGTTMLGYWIGRQYWGQGMTSQALAAFLPLISARPIFAHVAQHNVASQRLLLRQGFVLNAMVASDELSASQTVKNAAAPQEKALLEFVLR